MNVLPNSNNATQLLLAEHHGAVAHWLMQCRLGRCVTFVDIYEPFWLQLWLLLLLLCLSSVLVQLHEVADGGHPVDWGRLVLHFYTVGLLYAWRLVQKVARLAVSGLYLLRCDAATAELGNDRVLIQTAMVVVEEHDRGGPGARRLGWAVAASADGVSNDSLATPAGSQGGRLVRSVRYVGWVPLVLLDSSLLADERVQGVIRGGGLLRLLRWSHLAVFGQEPGQRCRHLILLLVRCTHSRLLELRLITKRWLLQMRVNKVWLMRLLLGNVGHEGGLTTLGTASTAVWDVWREFNRLPSIRMRNDRLKCISCSCDIHLKMRVVWCQMTGIALLMLICSIVEELRPIRLDSLWRILVLYLLQSVLLAY